MEKIIGNDDIVECAFPEDFAAVHVGDVFEPGFNQLTSFLNHLSNSNRVFIAFEVDQVGVDEGVL
jgi:hypothetical protein